MGLEFTGDVSMGLRMGFGVMGFRALRLVEDLGFWGLGLQEIHLRGHTPSVTIACLLRSSNLHMPSVTSDFSCLHPKSGTLLQSLHRPYYEGC